MQADITEAEQAEIIGDFERGRAHVLFQLCLKMTHWQQFPWVLYAAGSSNEETVVNALEKLSRCHSDHPQVAAFKSADVQAEIRLFLENPSQVLQSDDPEALPSLRRLLVASMRLAYCAERKIEGKHAKSKRGVTHAPCHSAPYVSLLHRLPDIQRALEEDHEHLKELASQVSRVSSGRIAVRLLGLQRHPECCQARNGRDPVYTQIIYHADGYSKYVASVTDFSAPQPPASQGPQRVWQSEGEEALRHNVAVEHLRLSVSNSDVFYSMPMQPGVFRTLISMLAPRSEPHADNFFQEGLQAEGGSDGQGPGHVSVSAEGEVSFRPQMDIWSSRSEVGPSAKPLREHVYWKVVKGESLARAPRAHAEGELSLKDVLAVTLHSASSADAKNRIVNVCTSPLSLKSLHSQEAVVTLNPRCLSLNALEGIVAWQPASDALSLSLSFEHMHKLPPSARKVLPGLLQKAKAATRCGGFHAGKQPPDVDSALAMLRADDVLQGPPWTFTQKGQALLETCAPLKCGSVVLKRAEAGTLPENMTRYQLLREL